MKTPPIPTFIINLKVRADRRQHIMQQFAGREEFNVKLVEPVAHEVACISLWNTIKHIVNELAGETDEFVLICEDDHVFTSHYTKEKMAQFITSAQSLQADVCIGGISSMTGCLKVAEDLYWVEKFSATQFIVLFRKFFDKIATANFDASDTADYKISSLTNSKYFIYPFISTQKAFGYSDVTPRNNKEVDVEKLFTDTAENVRVLNEISKFYNEVAVVPGDVEELLENVFIPTYIINLPERKERRVHALAQFEDKPEFDVKVEEACKHPIGAVGLWKSIRKIVQKAIEHDDDVIIICEDDHTFTKDYSKEYLFSNIIASHYQGVEYLSGGTSNFTIALPVSANRFWVSSCLATQFIVLYRNIFQKILDRAYDDTVVADQELSAIAYNKMVLFPSVSVQKDFGYSDASPVHNERPGIVAEMFGNANNRLHVLQSVMVNQHLKTIC